MIPQPVIYLCAYTVAGVGVSYRHAVALSREPRPDTDEVDCLPDVLAEVLGRALGVDPDTVRVVSARRVDAAGGEPRYVFVCAPRSAAASSGGA